MSKPKPVVQIQITEGKTGQLHQFAASGDQQKLKVLIETGVNVNVTDKLGQTPLHHAAYAGNLNIVKLLLKNGAKINAKDENGMTALHHSCTSGQLPVIEYLLQKGANVDEPDEEQGTPLLNACDCGHTKVVALLLKKGAKVTAVDKSGTTCMHFAAVSGHDAVMELLIANGVKVELIDNNGATPLHYAAKNGHLKAMRLLLKSKANINVTDHHGQTPLHLAAYASHKECVKEILEHCKTLMGMDFRTKILSIKDHTGNTALHKIAFMGDVDTLQLLLENKAEIDALDKMNATPLHKAAFKGNAACVRLLLERGARVDLADNTGGTPLYNACYNGHVKCVELLLEESKEDPKKQIAIVDNNGRSPMHPAASFGFWECTKILIEKKGDVNLKDKDGTTPLHLASFNGSQLSMAFLLESGADPKLANKDGITSLHYAAYAGFLPAVHLLIKKGAEINAVDNKGATAVHYAACCNHWEVLSYLVFCGGSLDLPNNEGMTPLAYATRTGAVDSVVTLLEKDADPDLADKKGNTPRKLSRTRNNPTKRIFDTIGTKPYSPEALARLTDFRDKKLAKAKAKPGNASAASLDQKGPKSKNVNHPFNGYGYSFDLNDASECINQAYNQAREINHHWTVLNICRLFLLVPCEDQGRKMWNLLEMFLNQIVTHETAVTTLTTKFNFDEFRKADKNKKENKAKRNDFLSAIEKAFPIIFPVLPKRDEYTDVTFTSENMEPDEIAPPPGSSSSSSSSSGSKDSASEPKKKKKKPRKQSEDDEYEYEDEEEEEEEELPSLTMGGGGAMPKSDPDDLFPMSPGMSVMDLLGGGGGGGGFMGGGGGPPPPPGGGPPPPPPPGGGPPPPPPPGGKGGPPPPPGGGPKKPLMKMRKLDWKKIGKGQLNGTVWKLLKPEGMELDMPSIIQYFKIPDEPEGEKKKPATEKISVVDMKRSQHIGLMLSMMKWGTYDEIADSINKAEDHKFNEDNLRQMVKLAPASEEVEGLKQYVGAPPEKLKQLGDADRFIVSIIPIPRYQQKVASFLFKKTFETQSARLREDVELAYLALNELNNNVLFAKLLELILNIGNVLNQGTYAGNCYGFALDSLSKIRDAKSPTYPDITLLHYLLKYISEKRGNLLKVTEQLQYIGKGSAEHIVCITGEFSELNNGFTGLKSELEELQKQGLNSDPFVIKMKDFANRASADMKKLSEDFERLNKANADLYRNFAADKQTDIVMVVQAFLTQFEQARQENELRELKKKEAKEKKKKRKKIKKKKTTTSSKTKGIRSTPQLSEGGDDLREDESDEESESEDIMDKLFPEKKEESSESSSESEEEPGLIKKKIKKKKMKKKIMKKKKDDGDDGGGEEES